ncbi:MAG: hypothetical protein ACRDA4_04475 [Filifactoraceae bacterium]
MQAIAETLFDVIYLSLVITLGLIMIFNSNNNFQYRLFGIMAIILGLGDSFHLIPRAYALCTTGLENYVFALGIGKFITSITMTIFYVILYHIWHLRYNVTNTKMTTFTIYFLAVTRIALCLFPQNAWTSSYSPLSWGIYRNLPFAMLGLLIILLFYKSAKQNNDSIFKNMWLAILTSFGFYIPVVLFSDSIPIIGLLMIPKTCAYVWSILIGYNGMKKECKKI